MTYNIAVAGKGGVGKTSLTGLLIDTLVKQKKDQRNQKQLDILEKSLI